MLNGAGDAAGDVQVRGNNLSRLADLIRLGSPAGVDGRAGCAHRCTENSGQFFDDDVVFRPLHAAAAGNDDVGLGQIDLAARILLDLENLGLQLGRIEGRIEFDDLARLLASRRWGIRWGAATPSGDTSELHLAEALAGIHGSHRQHLPVGDLDIRTICGHARRQRAHQAGRKVLPLHRSAEKQNRRIFFLHDLGDGRGMGIRRIGLEGGVVRHVNLIHAVLCQLAGNPFNAGTQEHGAHFLSQLICQFPGRRRQARNLSCGKRRISVLLLSIHLLPCFHSSVINRVK